MAQPRAANGAVASEAGRRRDRWSPRGSCSSGWSRSASRSRTASRRCRSVDLDVRRGEFLSLLGPSGCGKSTILRLLAGLTQPSIGYINWIANEPRPRLRLPGADADAVGERVRQCLAAAAARRPVARDARRPQVEEALAKVGLSGFDKAYPRELSGGMKMRVSIARALVTRPAAAADGRAVRRARRDHPHQAQRRPRGAQVRTRTRPSSSSPTRCSKASISPTASSSWRRGPAGWSPRSTCRRRCRATRTSASDPNTPNSAARRRAPCTAR